MPNPKVIVIPKVEQIRLQDDGKIKKKRVCAYARVSTDFEDQRNSFNAQLDEFKRKIQRNPEWEFIGLYSDEGISGTNLKKREGFKRMISDALEGKIDLILVKSISRFARNTIDFLGKVRQLKDHGVEVFFEKENISSLDERCEIMLTMFACFAQEESRQISTNVTWGVRKRMANGERKINADTLLGYKSDGMGGVIIDEETAKYVREIYELFIAGYTYREIASVMERQGVLTTTGSSKWNVNNVGAVLSNEKYCGDMICQKTYTPNFLDHSAKKNEGQVAKYLTVGHHEGIVDRETFAYVQSIRSALKDKGRERFRSFGPLSGLVFCECCGRNMRYITAHRGKPWEKRILTCKNEKGECSINSSIPYDLVLKVIENIVKSKVDVESIKANAKDTLLSKKRIDAYIEKRKKVIDLITENEEKLKSLIKEQFSSGRTIADFNEDYQRISDEIKELRTQLEEIERRESEFRDKATLEARVTDYIEGTIPLTNEIVKKFVFRIVSRGGKTIRVILNDGKITERYFNENSQSFMEGEPSEMGVEKSDKDFIIYEMVKPEDIYGRY